MIPRDDMIRMARETGLAPACDCLGLRESDVEALEKFTAMVEARAAAAEREACAQVVESSPSYDWHRFACETAYAIRARGAA